MSLPSWIIDPLVRRKAGVHRTPLDRYTIRIARTQRDYEASFRLLRLAYICMGYESVFSTDLRITQHHLLREATVLLAFEGEQLVGTMTVTVDSPVGLPVDKYFAGPGLQALRKNGERLVELGSLAVVDRCKNDGVTLLLNMAAYQLAYYRHQGSHFVVTVRPRVAGLYRAIFGFKALGEPRPHREMPAFPIVGLALDLNQAQPFMRRHYKKPLASGLRLVDHFTTSPPDCIQIPDEMDPDTYARWKMPRNVFRQLFVEGSDELFRLENKTHRYLAQQRSDATLRHSTYLERNRTDDSNELNGRVN